MKYYLYNSKANNGIRPDVDPSVELIDANGMNYPQYFDGLKEDDEVVLVGGDGTLNYFINAMKDYNIKEVFDAIFNGGMPKVLTMDFMFAQCRNLTTIIISNNFNIRISFSSNIF